MKPRSNTISRLMLSLVMVLAVLGATASPTGMMSEAGAPTSTVRRSEPPASPQDAPAQPNSLPAPLGPTGKVLADIPLTPAAELPTIHLNPATGKAGQQIQVTGLGVHSSPGVRIAWLAGSATQSAAVVSVDSHLNYTATVTVPAEAASGSAKVCVAVTGSEAAEFVCADFSIVKGPPGVVEGDIPLTITQAGNKPQTLNAKFNVYKQDGKGEQVRNATIEANGHFQIASIEEGYYIGVVSGQVPRFAFNVSFQVRSGETTQIQADQFNPNCYFWLPLCDHVHDAWASYIAFSIHGQPVSDESVFYSLGSSGSPVPVTFSVSDYQYLNQAPTGMKFELVYYNGASEEIKATTTVPNPPYQFEYNVSQLPPANPNLGQKYFVRVTPVTANPTPSTEQIYILSNPLEAFPDQFQEKSFTWDDSHLQYDFAGTFPNSGGILPMRFPTTTLGNLPLIGNIDSVLDAGIETHGTISLDQQVTISMFFAKAQAKVLGFDLFDALHKDFINPATPEDITPPVWNGQFQMNQANITAKETQIYSDDFSTQVYNGVLATYWGIVSLRASVTVGLQVGVSVEATIWPFSPKSIATLHATATPYVTISVWVDILFGLASAGADATASATFDLPLRIDEWRKYVEPDESFIYFDNPCLRFQVILRLWARVDLWFWSHRWNLGQARLVDVSKCSWAQASRPDHGTDYAPDPPRVMASPAIASGPNGETLEVEIDDTTPSEQTPTMRVMASFFDPATTTWGPKVALSRGTHSVQDPAVAFAGPSGHAIAVWTENPMTFDEDQAAGDDLSAILGRQELYAAYWNGTVWSDPERLITDQNPDGSPSLKADGRASLAGDELGATLAWTRDTDGDLTTSADRSIAVMQYDAATQTWGPWDLLNAAEAISQTVTTQVSEPQQPAQVDATFTVDSFLDGKDATPGDGICSTGGILGKCTLRAAVMESNALGGPNLIRLAPGTYQLTIAGRGEDAAATGDLDVITGSLVIQNTGASPVTIDGAHLDTVFQVFPAANLALANLSIINGDGVNQAGGIYNGGTTHLVNVTLEQNTAHWDGGAIWNKGTLTLQGCTLTSNVASGNGDGIHGFGGGIHNELGNLTVDNTYFKGNDAQVRSGGGISLKAGTLTLHNSTLAANTAHENGGGLWIQGSATLTNATLGWNTATQSGGGIYANTGTVSLNNVTVAFNRGASSGGVDSQAAATFNFTNSILGRNLADNSPSDCSGILTSQGYNLVRNSTGCTIQGIATGNITDVDPWLGTSLGFEGGQTPTIKLYLGSPAINNGSPAVPGSGGNACEATDQRGVARPQGARCDMGAYERQPGPGVMNSQVSVSRRHGQSVLAWAADEDGDYNTNSDRGIVIARLVDSVWQMERPAVMPPGGELPSIALGDNQLDLDVAFLVRAKDANGTTDTGAGNRDQLWTALYRDTSSGYAWTAQQSYDAAGIPIYAERPEVSVSATDQRLLLYRRFDAPFSTGMLGQIAISIRDPGMENFFPPIYLTWDNNQHWQQAFTLNPLTDDGMFVDVERPTVNQAGEKAGVAPILSPVTSAAHPSVLTTILSPSDDPVQSGLIKAGSDPALDPQLALSEQHAASGSSVTVTATLRNLGRTPASGLKVQLFAGTPPSGTLLSTVYPSGSLAFNQSTTVGFTVTAAAGQQPVYALVTGSDINSNNNTAAADLSLLPPATLTSVSAAPAPATAMRLIWLAPDVTGITGYRILRSDTPGGPYELVGEAFGTTTYTDLLLTRGKTYYYIIQAFDASGVRSINSNEQSGAVPLLSSFLPLVMR